MGGCPTGTAPGSFPRGGRKRGLQTDLQNEIVQEIEDLLARQSIADLDLEALEMAARCQALRLAARALEQRLNTDTSDYVGPELPCPCGGVARYHGRHGKTFESVLGPLHLKRAYYDCGRCHQGFCPRDRALKLESFSLTPGVLRMTASAAALVSFEESSGLLHELAGVEVSVKQVERAAEALGAEIAVDERQDVARMREVAPTLYLGLDGTGVPMRPQEVADRAGKQADGSAKTREAKLVTVWTAESRDREGKPVRDPGSISYSSAIESAATPDTSPHLSDFAARVQREASRRGFTEALRQVVLGDGATWIWNTATELFPPATQILDRFHAKEHLGEVGKVIYGDRPEGQAWIDARCEELDKGHLKSLVHALRSHIGFQVTLDRKSTRLNSSHLGISYAVFCLKKKKKKKTTNTNVNKQNENNNNYLDTNSNGTQNRPAVIESAAIVSMSHDKHKQQRQRSVMTE